MSHLTNVVYALMFLPRGAPIDGHLAKICLDHIERHGYQLAGIIHTYAEFISAYTAGVATVAVMARREHWDPMWEPRLEFATQDICFNPERPQLVAPRINEGGPHRRPRPMR
jgi:hypothetical protein